MAKTKKLATDRTVDLKYAVTPAYQAWLREFGAAIQAESASATIALALGELALSRGFHSPPRRLAARKAASLPT